MKVAPSDKIIQTYCRITDSISEATGKVVGWLIMFMVGILGLEVLLRSVFNSPTMWAHESSTYFFAAYFALAGAYALKHGTLVNVDVIYSRFSKRNRAIIDIITGIFTLGFLAVLTWKGFDLSLRSVMLNEHSQTVWRPPVYPMKITIFLGALLLGMQALAKFFRDIIIVWRNEE